jgi:hypothetical protein
MKRIQTHFSIILLNNLVISKDKVEFSIKNDKGNTKVRKTLATSITC